MATLKDVAKEAGLTVTTVSRVLNNRGYISEDARKRVAEAMKKLNYRPNELARSLQNKKTKTIGLIVPHIRHPYFAEMISNLENAAYKKGYKILLCNSRDDDDRMQEYIEMCTSNRVCGLILCSGQVSTRDFESLDIPVITVERFMETGTASILCDNYGGGRMAAECLIEKGCRDIMLIGSPGKGTVKMPADSRFDGFKDKCNEHQVNYVEIQTDYSEFVEMSYHASIEKALREHPYVDGVYANSDLIAVQTLQVCYHMGIQVPDQLKIIGFDDTLIAEMTAPAMTSIHQPIKEMASMALDLLVKAVNGESVPQNNVLPVSISIRETV